MLLRAFQRQVKFQCECVLIAAQEIDAAMPRHDNQALFCALQALLSAAANISKALWGASKKGFADRAFLRASLQVADNSPVHLRNMRNHFDHFDARLDEWWITSKRHNMVDMAIMSRTAILGVDDIDRFRAFDPQTGDATFAGDNFNIKEIVSEVQRILPLAAQEANKPHWVPCKQVAST